MELEKAEALQDELIETVERHGASTYSSDDENWFRLGRGAQLSGYPAIGIAIGEDGYRPAIRIQRRTFLDEDLYHKLSEEAGEDIDFQIINPVQTFSRPEIGRSISHIKCQSGTLGCFVQRNKDDCSSELMLLSNNHVIANNNDAKIGDIVLQPGRQDGGKKERNVVGHLEHWVPLMPRGNRVDAAVARVVECDIPPDEINVIQEIGRVSNIYSDRILPPLQVKKFGRTTSLTYGTVSAVLKKELEVRCGKRGCQIKRGFLNVIEIESNGSKPFSKKGDSGSLIVDEQNRAVALLFAGNEYKTFAISIADVFENLELSLPKNQ